MPQASFANDLKGYSVRWDEIVDHIFINEIYNDTLPTEKFIYYLLQDHYFLYAFSKFLQSAKLRTNDHKMREWLEILSFNTINFEMKMQRDLLHSLGVTPPVDLASIIPSKTTRDYISFLVGVLSVGKFSEIISAMAPCPWTYLEISQKLSRVSISNKAYKSWVEFYSSDESYKQVEKIQQILNLLSEEEDEHYRQKMIYHFVEACNYEFHFWEMAYNLEG
jgi:thiaminase/transcriptional activator TenA